MPRPLTGTRALGLSPGTGRAFRRDNARWQGCARGEGPVAGQQIDLGDGSWPTTTATAVRDIGPPSRRIGIPEKVCARAQSIQGADMAKCIITTEMTERAISDAFQIHGGYAYATGFAVEYLHECSVDDHLRGMSEISTADRLRLDPT